MSEPLPPSSPDPGYRFSYGRFVFFTLGAGVLALVVGVPIILALAHWTPVAGLVAALVTVLAMIAAIGLTARRLLATAEAQIRSGRDQSGPR